MYPISIRSALLLGTALSFSVPAAAQQILLPEPSKEEISPPELATGDEAPSNTIVVTARRRSESAQDVPLAISVIDAQQLDDTGSFNVARLQQLTPTLQFYSSNPRNTAVNIRGLGVPFGLTSDGFEQGVGIYIDDGSVRANAPAGGSVQIS